MRTEETGAVNTAHRGPAREAQRVTQRTGTRGTTRYSETVTETAIAVQETSTPPIFFHILIPSYTQDKNIIFRRQKLTDADFKHLTNQQPAVHTMLICMNMKLFACSDII